MDQEINGKTILIPGGTGSFGTTVLERLLGLNPKKIVIFSRDEKKQFDLRNKHKDDRLEFIIGDVRDKERVAEVMRGVDLVFHAAALKHVPPGEFFPLELVKTNILGSAHVMQAAISQNVERVVILSTDKAVYPINAMGMTKALMEKTMIAYSRNQKNDTVLCGVRYGNVMYSRGSVIPLFVEQIKQNKPITVTNKDMTRFMLPLPYSVDLVLYALTHGEPGDLFVKKAPACTVGTLVEALKALFKYDREIENIGTRGGEKTHETLISKEEMLRAEDKGDYYRIPPESKWLQYGKYFTEGVAATTNNEGYTSENTQRLSLQETIELLKTLPEIQEELLNYEHISHQQ